MKNKISNGMKISDKEIEKLAGLARIKLSEKEKKGLKKDIESILGYVSEIQEVSEEVAKGSPLLQQRATLCNVMREDIEPHKSGLYTEKILKEAPQREGDYVKVKKIL
mgnify:CR=1 FL=1